MANSSKLFADELAIRIITVKLAAKARFVVMRRTPRSLTRFGVKRSFELLRCTQVNVTYGSANVQISLSL